MKKDVIETLVDIFLILVVVVLTAVFHLPWWCFIAEFFCYMMAFSHLMAILLETRNPHAGKVLDRCALIFGILFILSFIALFIVGEYA